MKLCAALVCLVMLAGAHLVHSAEPMKVAGRQTKTIEGWSVLISDELMTKDKAATERALELLTTQLQEITRVVPNAAVVELRKVPLWFSPEYPKVQPRAEYHPGAGWLRDNNRDPAMAKAVEFTNIRIFERETKRMPNFTLHELAHAYHDRVLAKGFGNEAIKAAFEKAKENGLYDRVEQRFGDGRSAHVRAYAMTSPMEYFAECSEAFFSTNDFFPFSREQLAKHDPEMLELLHKLWLCAAPSEATKAKQQLPNIIFLLADDLGGGDLHCYGHPYSRTPNIDSLARDGTRFMQFNATGATCCPARTGLMTSKFPATYPTYPANGGFANRVTVTELLKKQGYAIGHFGKWHIGPEQKPGTYGIDSINSGEQEQGGKKKQGGNDRGRDAHIYDEAIEFIEQHKAGPFYVNVWGHISHNPVNPTEALVKRWSALKVKDSDFPEQMSAKFSDARKAGGDVDDGMRRYLADIESLDDSVGRLLNRLDELGLRENTIVVFSSDQGADMTKAALGGLRLNQMGFNGPHRGGKHTHWEGGVRVPWIVRWPGHVPAGRKDDQSVLSGVDWLPTLCTIAGVKVNVADFDGEDTSAAWLGKGPHVRTKPLLWKTSSPGSESFIREGQWKLRHPTRKNHGELELYDIVADPAESKNLAAQHPDLVKRLSAKVGAWVAALPKEYLKTKDQDD